MVLVWISQVTNDVRHIFMCVFVIHASSLVKCPNILFFLQIVFILWRFESSLYILDTSPLSDF